MHARHAPPAEFDWLKVSFAATVGCAVLRGLRKGEMDGSVGWLGSARNRVATRADRGRVGKQMISIEQEVS